MGRPIIEPEVVSDAVAAILRKKTEAERLQIAFGMWNFARDLIRTAVKQDHPEWTEQQVHGEVVRRLSHGAVQPPPQVD